MIALGPIPVYGLDLRWPYWLSAGLFLALWVKVGPVSNVVSKLLGFVTRGHAGLTWAIYSAAFLWCFALGWVREAAISPKLAVATVLLFVAGFLSGGQKDDPEK